MNTKRIIYRMINEALGVPEGLLETAEQLYDEIFSKLKGLKKLEGNEDKGMKVIIKDKKNISDFFIEKFEVYFDITKNDSIKEVDIMGMAVKSPIEFNSENVTMKNIMGSKIEILIKLIVPEKWTYKDVENLFIKNKDLSVFTLRSSIKKLNLKVFISPFSNNSFRVFPILP